MSMIYNCPNCGKDRKEANFPMKLHPHRRGVVICSVCHYELNAESRAQVKARNDDYAEAARRAEHWGRE